MRRPLFWLAFLLALTGCATVRHSNTSVLEVPFIAQQPNYCGPAALAMLANYYGQPVTQDEIAGAIYLPEIRGTLTADLADYAQRCGLWVRQYRGNRADLCQKLAAGVPLIVLGKLGINEHYFVVLAYRDGEFTVHSDTRANLHLREDDFLRWWNRADRWTLLVCPPARTAWRLSADEHNDLGVFLERTGQFSAAAGHYREAVELTPRNSYFAMNLGNALMKQNLYAEAATAFRRAGDNPDALNNLAYVLGELNANLDEAVALCERAIKLQPSHRAYYLDTLGGILIKRGQTREAVAVFESALGAATEHQSELRAGIAQRLAAARALIVE
jgi:tetratricopeptide (TPR) repeat protein